MDLFSWSHDSNWYELMLEIYVCRMCIYSRSPQCSSPSVLYVHLVVFFWQLTISDLQVLQDEPSPPRCWRFRGRLAGGTRRSQGVKRQGGSAKGTSLPHQVVKNRWSTMVTMIQLYQLGWVYGLKAGPCQSRDRSWQSPLPSGVSKQLEISEVLSQPTGIAMDGDCYSQIGFAL